MADQFTDEDDELLAALGVEAETKPEAGRSAREERIIAGFEEIQRFVETQGRAPRHGEGQDIFERLYAVRLDRLRAQEDCRALLEPFDSQGLLSGEAAEANPVEDLDDDELLAQLGVEASPAITELKHVRTAAEKRAAAEEVATRRPCADFERFKPLFQQVQKELDAKLRLTRSFELKAQIQQGSWFIVEGQKAYVADVEERFTNAQGRTDARLRVIFDNGTESNMLMRSLQRAMNKDETSRRILDPIAGPLFAGSSGKEGDEASGTIYVLRSKSAHPTVAANREILHKIGVTSMKVSDRIAGAQLQPTFLLAPVEVVATYELYNIQRSKLENLIHRIFGAARLEIEIQDRFGNPVTPREWFLAPLFAINEAIERIKDGTITEYVYDPASASLKRRAN